MSVIISSNFTQRTYFWEAWKLAQKTKKFVLQFEEDDVGYLIWGYDGPEIHLVSIWKGEVPSQFLQQGYTQLQNDLDLSDFETNYKSSGNASIEEGYINRLGNTVTPTHRDGIITVSGKDNVIVPLPFKPRSFGCDFTDDIPPAPSCDPAAPDDVSCEVEFVNDKYSLKISWDVKSTRQIKWTADN